MRKAWPQMLQVNFFSGSVLGFDPSGDPKGAAGVPLHDNGGISSSGPSGLCGDF